MAGGPDMSSDPLPAAAVRPQPAPLLERDGELAMLGALLADVRAGEGRLGVIEGPAGIGKTRLLEEARAAAADMGLDVLSARAGELESDFGFGVVRQLLEGRLAATGEDERAEFFAGAAGLAEAVITPSTEAPASADVSHAALHGLYWLVANLAERSPLLLAVDDLQWADGPSLRFLHHLVTRLEGVPVAIVACRRSGEAAPEPELVDRLILEAEVLRPAALSGGAVASIVRAQLGEDAAPELCDACGESSQGNPFLLGELLLELREDRHGAAKIDPAAIRELGPQRIATAVLLRVGRLGPDAQALARALAVLGETEELPLAAALAELEPTTAAELVDSLRESAVLSAGPPLRFAHPVVRTAIHQETPASERASLQRRAADLLADDPEQAAVHLLATDPGGSERTVIVLRAAARAALARGAGDSAVRYLRRALAEPPEPESRPGLLAELGRTGSLVGEPDAIELEMEAFRLTDEQPARAEVGVFLGHHLFDSREPQPERAVAVLERSLDGLEDPQLAGVVETMLLTAGVTSLAAKRLVADRIQETRQRVERLSDEQARLALVPLALDTAISGTAAETTRLAERALGDGELVRFVVATTLPFAHMLAVALTHAGEVATAERTLTDAIAGFRERGVPVPIAAGAAFRAHARFLAGRLAAAEADARFCLEAPGIAVWPIPTGGAAAALTFTLVERGQLVEAREVLEGFEASAYDVDAPPLQPLRASRAQLLAAEGEPEEALATWRECERWEREWDGSGLWIAWRSQAALCHLALGDDERARELAGEELELARRFGAQRAIGVALHAQALAHAADQDILAEAVEVLHGCGARLEHARALVDLGSSIRRSGNRADARPTLAEGADLAHRCGATALVEHAREELRLAGARPRRIAQSGRDALTPAEVRVVELAAEGQTNKQIAQALFVTLRTVEMHLSNSYRKLEIESRRQLPVALRAT